MNSKILQILQRSGSSSYLPLLSNKLSTWFMAFDFVPKAECFIHSSSLKLTLSEVSAVNLLLKTTHVTALEGGCQYMPSPYVDKVFRKCGSNGIKLTFFGLRGTSHE